MKKLLILSGKGGTGKTTTAAAFIAFSNALAFADCDVDAPNLHIVTRMNAMPERSDFQGSQKAVIDVQKCIGCGLCREHCRFDAIHPDGQHFTVDEYACEGCGVCEYVCPVGAAVLHDDVSGELELYRDTRVFSTAKLKMGRGNSGKLVTQVKTALTNALPDTELQIIDGSPGIGCPVIASVSGVDLVLVVAEPTLSGFSDMQRILKTAAILGAKTAVCINKYDTCIENTRAIETFCKENNIPYTGRIPYDKHVPEAINAGRSIADIDCPAKNALHTVYERTMAVLYQ
ncbi:MAG TPA: ATP-binding protein [Oscillospiraceae bacterium]|nr:ATP-binding protein [Oscillospiraceae bacterium]HPF55934.1 ATP-binding protein [Clostridiales bacterium]HPK36111.1 ATP-binding protein [Oscillospiraceae bacterium]HPR76626.1 ATP-binding protein [Oscillospiraceae bacterium]